jgi:hypothetical protein
MVIAATIATRGRSGKGDAGTTALSIAILARREQLKCRIACHVGAKNYHAFPAGDAADSIVSP